LSTASHAEGMGTIAEGDYTHAEGYNSKAVNVQAHAEGHTTTASGEYSHSEGADTVASGRGAHTEGRATKAMGDYSHAEGRESIAKGEKSHAEGNTTFADGEGSHSEGCNTHATGIYSHTEGEYTTGSGRTQHVQGRFNINDVDAEGNPLNRYAHIVGNGTSDSDRSNAHTLDWSGNACYSGDVYVNGADAETGKKLATEEFVNNAVVNDSKWTTLGLITLSGTDGGVSADFPCDLNEIREASDLRYVVKAGSYLTGTMAKADTSGAMTIETLKEPIYDSSYVILEMKIDGTSQTKGSSETINISEDIIIPLNKDIYNTGVSRRIIKKISDGKQSIESTFDELIGLRTYTSTSSNYMTFEYSFVIELQKR